MGIKIVIPNYIRRIKMSEKQLPVYYEYKNGYIKAKNKPLPNKYLTKQGIQNRIVNNGKIHANDLKDDYCFCAIRNNKVIPLVQAKPNDKQYLYDMSIKERVLANPLKAGTPRMKVINGQDIFSGKIQSFEKEVIMYHIKKSYIPYIQNLPPFIEKMYPLRIRLYLYDSVKNEFDNTKDDESAGIRWDMINRSYMYSKAFCDLLTEGLKDKSISVNKILVDDDRLHVTEDGGAVFCPIEKSENRRLVFVIAKDDENFANEIKEIEEDRLSLLKNNKFYKHLYK